MKRIYGFLIAFVFSIFSFAGNIAGGDIKIRCVGGMSYEFTITMWGNHFSSTDLMHFSPGDNTYFTYSIQSAVSIISLAPTYPNDSEIKWIGIHNYPGPGTYSIGVTYTNRNCGIVNIPNSYNTIMMLPTSNLVVDPNIGCNNSPNCANSNLIELLAVSTNNNFNLGAVDPDGDSLSYSILPCLDTTGVIVGYTWPNILGGGAFGINAVTGDYYWNSPTIPGLYNFVIEIEEWKLFPNGNRYLIGNVSREMQFNVGNAAGISEQNSFAFSCFPNPISQNQELHFQFEKEGNYSFKILDAEGKTVFENSFYCGTEQSINLPALSPGIYFLNVSDENHIASCQKITIL